MCLGSAISRGPSPNLHGWERGPHLYPSTRVQLAMVPQATPDPRLGWVLSDDDSSLQTLIRDGKSRCGDGNGKGRSIYLTTSLFPIATLHFPSPQRDLPSRHFLFPSRRFHSPSRRFNFLSRCFYLPSLRFHFPSPRSIAHHHTLIPHHHAPFDKGDGRCN